MRHFETHVGPLPNESDARLAHKAYCSTLTRNGKYNLVAEFDDLSIEIKVAWCNAAIAVFNRVKEQSEYKSKKG